MKASLKSQCLYTKKKMVNNLKFLRKTDLLPVYLRKQGFPFHCLYFRAYRMSYSAMLQETGLSYEIRRNAAGNRFMLFPEMKKEHQTHPP